MKNRNNAVLLQQDRIPVACVLQQDVEQQTGRKENSRKESVQRKVASAPLFRLTKSSKRKAPTLYLYNAPVNMDSSHQKGLRTRQWQKIARMLRDPLERKADTSERDPKKNIKGGKNRTHSPIFAPIGPTHFLSQAWAFSAFLFGLVLPLQSQIALFQSRLKRYFKTLAQTQKDGVSLSLCPCQQYPPRNPTPTSCKRVIQFWVFCASERGCNGLTNNSRAERECTALRRSKVGTSSPLHGQYVSPQEATLKGHPRDRLPLVPVC